MDANGMNGRTMVVYERHSVMKSNERRKLNTVWEVQSIYKGGF